MLWEELMLEKLNSKSKPFLVMTSEADLMKAESLAVKLLEMKLVACVSFYEINSKYFWKGEICSSGEVQLTIKTSRKNLDELLMKIKDLHSYDTPELIYWPVKSDQKYEDWLFSVIK